MDDVSERSVEVSLSEIAESSRPAVDFSPDIDASRSGAAAVDSLRLSLKTWLSLSGSA